MKSETFCSALPELEISVQKYLLLPACREPPKSVTAFPERAEKLFEKAEKVAADKYAHLEKLASLPDAE